MLAMGGIDVLVVAALQEEFDAVREVAARGVAGDPGVQSWEEHDEEPPPYHLGRYRLAGGGLLHVALARPIEMGGAATGAVAGPLTERLRPRCLAMSGVCAGNPAEVVLGDVIFASFAYRYQAGKQTTAGFHPDNRQTAAYESWIRAAQDLPLVGLSTNGPATEDEARRWVLERLAAGEDPRTHRARSRYIANNEWAAVLAALESDGLITMPVDRPRLTKAGREHIQRASYLDVTPPHTLPYCIKVGPMASGDIVVKDGMTWDRLRAQGVETVAGLEMEAATVARTASSRNDLPWIVVKGVMDYADPGKDDRFKPFAARAAAEVMFRLLATQLGPKARVPQQAAAPPAAVSSLSLSDDWTHRADVDHDRLFGTEEILERLGQALNNQNGDWLISVFGDGGAGKTTLVYEMVKQHARSAGFRRVAWASAKFSHLRALGNVDYTRHAAIGWHDLLLDIARQLDLRVQQNPVQIEERLADALAAAGATEPCVIVIDNLETLNDAELAMRFFSRRSMLQPHKVIITTRQSTRALAGANEVREFSWRGLSYEAVLAFARHLAADDPGFELNAEDVAELVAMSSGIPLLVKMTVRLAMHEAQPVTVVIDQVRDPSGALGERVGLYLYEQAMYALAASPGVGADAAMDLMNVFCGRPPGESFTATDFFELSLIGDRDVFDRARVAAHSLALIRGIDGNRRFTVHPLLREYICKRAKALL
jgi:nucleoside phosphorylase